MRKAAVIPFLCVALLGGAGASLALVPRTLIPHAQNVRLDRLVCVSCVLLSALCGLAGCCGSGRSSFAGPDLGEAFAAWNKQVKENVPVDTVDWTLLRKAAERGDIALASVDSTGTADALPGKLLAHAAFLLNRGSSHQKMGNLEQAFDGL